MFPHPVFPLLLVAAALLRTVPGHAQKAPPTDALRVTVSQNTDGSRTTYEVDPGNRRAVATTTSAAGKTLGKIRYVLDEAGRYESGSVFGPDDQLQFKTQYKYDAAGRLEEELRLNKDDSVTMKLVYAYDSNGRPAGYSVYDPGGRLLGRTRATGAAAPAAAAPAQKKNR